MINRSFLVLFSLVSWLVISCSDENKKPATSTSVPVVRVDSNSFISKPTAPNNYAPVDVSPMDMSYFPVEYPKLKIANPDIEPPVARVIYSRPQLQKRHLFKDLLSYKTPWRLGANESSEIQIYKPIKIQNKNINPGRYIIYCIPDTVNWSIIINRNTDTWGLKQDPDMDVARFTVPVSSGNPVLEYFTMVFEETSSGADLLMGWGDIIVRLPISL